MTPSPMPPTYSDFEAANAAFAGRLAALIASVTEDASRHARFLNTLSMLEHMGSRRIMLTRGAGNLDQMTLKHMAEEARHAFFFKRQADRISGRSLGYVDADMIAPACGRMYFRRLEARIAAAARNDADPSLVTYLYMSLIVEFRAIWAFAVYQARLDQAGIRMSLKSLLAEERGHLGEMKASLERLGATPPDRMRRFLDVERTLFARLLAGLEDAVAPAAHGPVIAYAETPAGTASARASSRT